MATERQADTMHILLNKFFFKSSLSSDIATIQQHERYMKPHSFVNPVGLIKKTLREMSCHDELVVKVTKWYPSNMLPFVYNATVYVAPDANPGSVHMEVRDFFTEPTNITSSAHEIAQFFETVVYEFGKKITCVQLNNRTIYDNDIRTYSFVNPYIQEIASDMIKDRWKKCQQRRKQAHTRQFRGCLDEVLYIPPGGYTGKARHIHGGQKYWEACLRWDCLHL